MIAISCESACDLTKEMLERYNIFTVPFHILVGDKTYYDGELDIDEIFDYYKKTDKLAKTSAVNAFQFKEHFKKLKDLGYDKIIHFSLSSGISSAYQNAVTASKEFEGIEVIDSLALSTGIALEAIYASNLVKDGKSFEEIVKASNERRKFAQSSCIIESVTYLHRGGRCSFFKMIGANLLRLKPVVYINNETGKLEPKEKFRGPMKKVVNEYIDKTLEKYNNPDKSLAFITYTNCNEELLSAAKEKLLEAGFKEVLITRAGATIACHCGPGCFGILYMNDGNR